MRIRFGARLRLNVADYYPVLLWIVLATLQRGRGNGIARGEPMEVIRGAGPGPKKSKLVSGLRRRCRGKGRQEDEEG